MTNILISGLTAAGKTTHAKLLAESLNYTYVSATQLIASMIGVSPAEVDDQFWVHHGDEVEHLRNTTDLDLELDRKLLEICSDGSDLVVDAWAAPWLVPDDGSVRVWLSSSRQTRAMKAAVSASNDQPVDWYHAFVGEKDDRTRAHFLRLYSFDLVDYESADFDVVIDNSSYIREATRESADQGIRGFRPEFESAICKLIR